MCFVFPLPHPQYCPSKRILEFYGSLVNLILNIYLAFIKVTFDKQTLVIKLFLVTKTFQVYLIGFPEFFKDYPLKAYKSAKMVTMVSSE